MENIDFKTLVDALKGKGPGDFIKDATGGVLAGSDLAFERKKQAFLEKVKELELQNDADTLSFNKSKATFEASNKVQDDIRSLAGGLVGSETRDPATNRVTGYTPPKYSPDIANTLAQEAYRALNEAYGTAPPAGALVRSGRTSPAAAAISPYRAVASRAARAGPMTLRRGATNSRCGWSSV